MAQGLKENFLGRGPKFPITIEPGSGGYRRSAGPLQYFRPDSGEDLERIQGSVEHILTTPIGSRYFLPEFGSKLKELVFEQNDEVLFDLIRVYIIEALAKWEPRIRIISVAVSQNESDDHRVDCTINYEIIKTHVRRNYVYPFYREF